MNKRATKHKSATENSMLKFLTVSSVSSDNIVKGIIDDIIKSTSKHPIRSLLTSMFRKVPSHTMDVYIELKNPFFRF
jgi:hypothetical protein